MKWKKGLCLAAILLAGGFIISSSCQKHFSPPPASAPSTDLSNWMGSNLNALGKLSLRQLTLPASHDSAMYRSGILQSLARTQTLSIYGQLSVGIRYFDLRPQLKHNEFWMYHGPVTGPKLADVLQDVERFVVENHHELVLLKFSHYDGISDDTYRQMISQIKASLDPWLYRKVPIAKRLADVTLTDYVQHSGTIVLLCDGRFPVANPIDGAYVYRDWNSDHPENGDLTVYDQYSNTMSLETMKSDQLKKFGEFDGHCLQHRDVPCDLFLLSWTLTPPTGVLHYAPSANQELAQTMSSIKLPNVHGKCVNLLYVDDVESARATESALKMNLAAAH